MEVLAPASLRIDGPTAEPPRRAPRVALRTLCSAAVAMVLVFLGMARGTARIARADDGAPSAKGASSHAAFVAGLQRALKADDLRLIALTNAVLEDPGASDRREDQLDRFRIDATRLEGESRYATLRREVAELALNEYVEAILPHDLLTAEAALAAARTDQAKARAQSENAFGEVGKITAQLEMKRAQFAIEGAESSKRVLVEYTKPKRTSDLQSELAKARSDEKSKKAEWELLKGRIERTQKAATAGADRTDVETRILALLDRAVSIEERIQARLGQFKKEPDHNDAAEKEVLGQMDQLGAIIDEAEAVKAAADFARVKPRLRKAGGGSSSKAD
jgi:hypothetical protein